jgi:hypothetical protein
MPIKLGWLVEHRITYQQYIGDVTLEEISQVSELGLHMLEETDVPLLHTVLDSTHLSSFPHKVGPLMKIVNSTLSHPKMGWMVSYGGDGDNDILRFVANVVISATRTRHRVMNDYDEAVAYLMEMDSTLPDLRSIKPAQDAIILYSIAGNNVTNATPSNP